MSTEQTHNEQPSDVANPDRGAGDGDAPMGNSLEAPRRPRSAAQIAAFEKARAKRMENMKAKRQVRGSPSHGEPPPQTAIPEPEPEPVPCAPKPAKRKPRSDKGKPRGFLVKHKPVTEPVEATSSESEDDYAPAEPVNLYSHFLIV